MLLDKIVKVSGRFQRSVNIVFDAGDTAFLEGYKSPQSSVNVLLNLANHVSESGHSSFTWTGPYGSGKSSLVIALSSLLTGNSELIKAAQESIGKADAEVIVNKLAAHHLKRKIISVVGSSQDPSQAIFSALKENGILSSDCEDEKSDEVISDLVASSLSTERGDDGIILFLDEMGKLLESASRGNGDVYFFQELAEAANRTNGRLIIIGILHQSFHEYSGRLSSEAKREWLKIEGRFIDLALNISGEEQIELIGRAIDNQDNKTKPSFIKPIVNEIINYLNQI